MARTPRGSWIALALIAATVAGHAVAAPLATRTELKVYKPVQHLAGPRDIEVRVFLATSNCSVPADRLEGVVTLKRDGVVEQSSSTPRALYSFNCEAGSVYGWTLFTSQAGFGDHVYTADYGGTGDFAPSTSPGAAVTVLSDYETTGLKAGVSQPQDGGSLGGWFCSATEVGAAPAGSPAFPGIAPAATLGYKFTGCDYGCGFLCPPGVPSFPQQRVRIEMPAVPEGSAVWLYNAGWGQATPGWRTARERMSKGAVDLYITGNAGERDISGLIAVVPAPPPPTTLQDMWWGGPAENGWGVGIAQSGESLFGSFYIYRGDGQPVWMAMAGGHWNAAHTAFSGDVFSPLGTAFGAYDASRWSAGPVLGSATLTFTGETQAKLDVTIGSASVHKALGRFAMGPDTTPGARSGLWWGGAPENGWGLQLQQQGSSLFATWYTYGADGSPHWYVMTDNLATDSGSSGTLFDATGSSWLGAAYDPALFKAHAVGTMSLKFDAADVGRMTYTVDGVTQSKVIYRFPF